MTGPWPALAALALGAAACVGANAEEAVTEPDANEEPSTVGSSAVPPRRAGPSVAPTASSTSKSLSTTTSTSTTAAPVVFVGSVRPVTAAELGITWNDSCPVSVEGLRRLDLGFWDYAGNAAEGVMIVHADYAGDVVGVFKRLFEARFPIERMQPLSEFGGDDTTSMTANNTSGFNCREIDGRPGVWSQHAYGGAIDVNPRVNPWVRGAQVDPPAGAAYADRSVSALGLIRAGDVVTEAFADIGWKWGGDWTSTIDYQHFSHDGR